MRILIMIINQDLLDERADECWTLMSEKHRVLHEQLKMRMSWRWQYGTSTRSWWRHHQREMWRQKKVRNNTYNELELCDVISNLCRYIVAENHWKHMFKVLTAILLGRKRSKKLAAVFSTSTFVSSFTVRSAAFKRCSGTSRPLAFAAALLWNDWIKRG